MTTRGQTRGNALWGKGSGGSRSNALWGKGTRGATLIALLLIGLLIPGGAFAGPGDKGGGSGGGGKNRDTTPPETTLADTPAEGAYVVGTSVTFTFSSNEDGVSFQCKLDEASSYGSCGNGSHTVEGLFPPAPHTFYVRAVDRAGNVDATPAARNFKPIPYLSTATYPQGSLLADSQASPYEIFRVIVQSENQSFLRALANWAEDNNKGRNKREFRAITALNTKLPGWAIIYIAEHEADFGKTMITRDRLVRPSDLGNGAKWQRATKADRLWQRDPITCLVDPITGLQIDPTCVADAGFTPPSTPAIAIVDSGVDATKVADFGGRVVASVNLSTLETQYPAGDGQGHGTMVAGVAAGASAAAPGVAQAAPIVSIRTSDENGQSLTSDVLAAVDWILANKDQYNIKVANFSMTGTEETSFKFDPLDRAVEKLWLNGVTVVTAAGNNGSADGPVKIGAPANDPFVITVGAVDLNKTDDPSDDFRAPWSAFGFTADGFRKPELVAPGRRIDAPVPAGSKLATTFTDRLTTPGYMWMSGTSFSSPMVAGTAAMLHALNPSWGPDQVKGALMLTTVPLVNTTGVGVGEVDAAAASAVTDPPNPNENFYAFVSTDSETGLREFNADAWQSEVSNNASWSSASWSSASWSSASWSSASWSSASWSSASWSSASWSSASWSSASWSSASWSSASWSSASWSSASWSSALSVE